MLNKVVGSIRGIRRHRTGFDSYLANVQGRGGSVPTIEEARKDFTNIMRTRTNGF